VLAIVLLAVNFRTVFASLPPLVDDIRDDLGLSAFAAGLLTALPVLSFGILPPLVPRLSAAFPIERLLTVCVLLTAAGTGARGVGGVAGLFLGTLLAGVAISVGQTLVPVLIRSRHHDDVGRLTGIFSMSLPLGAALGSAFAVPLSNALGGWQAALAVWALLGLAAFVLWMPAALRPGTIVALAPAGLPWRSGLAWSVAIFFGLQSMAFYAGLSWLPSILHDAGYTKAAAGGLQAVASVMQIAPAFLLPVLAGRRRTQTGLLTAVVGVGVVGVVGLLVAPGVAPLWIVCLGVSQGAALGLGLIFPVLRGRGVGAVASLTAMTLCVGYLVASTGPWILGLAHDLTGGWTVPLLILLVVTIAQFPGGLRASGEGLVGSPEPAA
jgi:CP family cyanate transporter-like MFS transporter